MQEAKASCKASDKECSRKYGGRPIPPEKFDEFCDQIGQKPKLIKLITKGRLKKTNQKGRREVNDQKSYDEDEMEESEEETQDVGMSQEETCIAVREIIDKGRQKSNQDSGIEDSQKTLMEGKKNAKRTVEEIMSQEETTKTQSPNKRPNKESTSHYSKGDMGPYLVHVQHLDKDKDDYLQPTIVSKILYKLFNNRIKEVKKAGRSKVSVECDTGETANSLTSSKQLTDYKLRAFIPTSRTARYGIIRDVPTEHSDEELMEVLTASARILELRRMTRRVKEQGVIKNILTKTIQIKFQGQRLPEAVYFINVRFTVTPHVPRVLICYACLRYGHIGAQCKGRPRCNRCGGVTHKEDEPCPREGLPARCGNCRSEHLTTSRECPVFIKHQQVNMMMATEGISAQEAREKIDGSTGFKGNYRNFSGGEFPTLPSTRIQASGRGQVNSTQPRTNNSSHGIFTQQTGLTWEDRSFANMVKSNRSSSYNRTEPQTIIDRHNYSKFKNANKNYNNNNSYKSQIPKDLIWEPCEQLPREQGRISRGIYSFLAKPKTFSIPPLEEDIHRPREGQQRPPFSLARNCKGLTDGIQQVLGPILGESIDKETMTKIVKGIFAIVLDILPDLGRPDGNEDEENIGDKVVGNKTNIGERDNDNIEQE